MPSPTARRAPTKRNASSKPTAKHKHTASRFRNAAPAPAPRARAVAAPAEPVITKKESLVHLVETLTGAGFASLVGAMAVKWGLHPDLVSAGLGGVGGWTAWMSPAQRNRFVALGAASAAGSQLLLMKLNPGAKPVKTAAPPPPQLAVAPPHVALPTRPKNADLGALPPGMLDAAFERARSELAVASDGYPHDYAHAHHHMT